MNRAVLLTALAVVFPAAAENFKTNPEAGNNVFTAVFDAKLGERITARVPRSPATSPMTRKPGRPPAFAQSRSPASRSTTRTPRPSTSSNG